MIPKYAKMEFPFYHGIKDTLSWLNLCDQYFEIHEKVETTMFHMRQKAQLWPNKLKQKEPGLYWDAFKTCCHLRFKPSPSKQHWGVDQL